MKNGPIRMIPTRGSRRHPQDQLRVTGESVWQFLMTPAAFNLWRLPLVQLQKCNDNLPADRCMPCGEYLF
jgi:hypothetical protein